MSCYIIKNKDCLTAYYYKDCKIYKIVYENGKWGDAYVIAHNAREDFSPGWGKGNMLVYQHIKGDICMIYEGRKPRVILENKGENCPNIVINAIFNSRLRLIYNTPVDKRKNYIVTQLQREDKEWSNPEKIDEFTSYFRIGELDEDRHILLYGRKVPEFQFGYREISSIGVGAFKMVYSTGYNVTDFSYLITEYALHFVFVYSTGFMQRLVYVKKDSEGLSSPQTIYEGLNIKNCLVGVSDNRLCVWWVSNRCLNIRASQNMGESFGKPNIIRGVNTNELIKGVFIDKTHSCYIFNEVYTDRLKPFSPYFADYNGKSKNKDIEIIMDEIDKIKKILEKKDSGL